MTIKQQGGIFGRNPTFNDLTVEGTVSVPDNSLTGSAIDGGDASVDSLNVDGAVTADAGSVFDAGTNFVPDNSAANKSLVLGSSGATGGTNQLGASVAFSRINTTSPRAAIAAIETDGSFERMGLAFYTHRTNNGSDPMVRSMMIRHDGHVFIDDTNLVFSTAGTGIDFSATSGTGTSELFDDYEEGTYTPTVNSGTCFVEYASYIKIGKMVHVAFKIRDLSDGTTASAINVSLPFTAGSFGASEWLGSWNIRRYDVSTSVSGAMRILGNGTTMDFRYSDSTVGAEPKSVNYDDRTSGTNEYLAGSITYFAAS